MRRALNTVFLAVLFLGAGDLLAQEALVGLPQTAPKELARDIPGRLGQLGETGVILREAPASVRKAAAALWVREALAPLETPACVEVLERLGISTDSDARRWVTLFDSSRPVARAPGARELLLPEALAAQDDAALELLRATGLLPFEIALSGEWARVVAARHLGPPVTDPVLRASRAARLEGVARLAGILVALHGARIDPQSLGRGLVLLDRDRVAFSREALIARASHPVERALIETFVEDGLRWAIYEYLKGGETGLLAALERPFVTPAELMRPGMRRRGLKSDPSACSLGPRAAAALVTGRNDEGWASALIGDAFSLASAAAVTGRLAFETEHEAERARVRLKALGVSVRCEANPRVLALTVAERVR